MGTVVREIVIDAPVERVWRHLVTPGERNAWFGGVFDVPLVPGGVGTFRDTRRERQVRVDDVQPGTSIAYSWGPDHDPSHVCIEVAPDRAGCRVRVTETTDVLTDRTPNRDDPVASAPLGSAA